MGCCEGCGCCEHLCLSPSGSLFCASVRPSKYITCAGYPPSYHTWWWNSQFERRDSSMDIGYGIDEDDWKLFLYLFSLSLSLLKRERYSLKRIHWLQERKKNWVHQFHHRSHFPFSSTAIDLVQDSHHRPSIWFQERECVCERENAHPFAWNSAHQENPCLDDQNAGQRERERERARSKCTKMAMIFGLFVYLPQNNQKESLLSDSLFILPFLFFPTIFTLFPLLPSLFLRCVSMSLSPRDSSSSWWEEKRILSISLSFSGFSLFLFVRQLDLVIIITIPYVLTSILSTPVRSIYLFYFIFGYISWETLWITTLGIYLSPRD